MKPLLLVGLIVTLVILKSGTYVIKEGRQVVITQFGKPVTVVKEPGIHWKTPFMQEVRLVDLRILSWDGTPTQIPTKEKTYIWVDTTARWKITDPLLFIQSVQNESGAKPRLDAILDSATRDIISKNFLVEVVRNSNNILDDIKEKEKLLQERIKRGEKIPEGLEEVIGDIGEVQFGREQLSSQIIDRADDELKELGVELVDVQIRRIEYVNEIKKKVYNRMISERLRIAEKIRSEGKGEKAKIEGKTEKELQSIESGAYKTVQKIKGAAEAKAINIYAKALRQSPKFYEFIRTLDAYDVALTEKTEFILSSDSAFLKIFQRGY